MKKEGPPCGRGERVVVADERCDKIAVIEEERCVP